MAELGIKHGTLDLQLDVLQIVLWSPAIEKYSKELGCPNIQGGKSRLAPVKAHNNNLQHLSYATRKRVHMQTSNIEYDKCPRISNI